MPTCKLSPIFNGESQFDTNGAFLDGGKLYWYLAGTSTPATTYTDNTGTTAHTNPIILTSTGQPPAPIWLEDGVAYKAVLKTSTDVAIGIPYDNITGVNQSTTSPNFAEWQTLSGALTYISGTSFSIAGDVTSTLQPGRRVKVTVSAGTVYGTVFSAVFGTSTTVVLVLDSGALDSGISAVSYGILAPTNSSIPKTYTDGWGGTAGGTADALTITVTPAISAYAAGQSFKFIPSATNATTAPTLNVNGLSAKTIKARGPSGKVALFIGSIVSGVETGVVYDGTDFVLEIGGGSVGNQTITASGNFTVPTCNYLRVVCIGPGGGGGSGARNATANNRGGGGGGGGGARVEKTFAVSQLGGVGAVIACTVPAGGTGGASVTVDTTAGNNGTNPSGPTTFGAFITAYAGARGTGGAVSGAGAGGTGGGGAGLLASATATSGGGSGSFSGANGSTSTVSGLNSEYGGAGGGGGGDSSNAGNGGSSFYSCSAGGGGGGLSGADVPSASGAAGALGSLGAGGGPAGGAVGVAGTNGAQDAVSFSGTGGGGGGSAAAAASGAGGNGGIGGGGGGGGASANGFASGAGGNGGRGEIRVFWW